jgi:1-phosphatidylinositol-3-phosphate 5-kinase
VASARAKVEVLDSVKDAIKDESDSSDSSSEADDEGDGNVEGTKTVPELIHESPESEPPISAPEVTVNTDPPPEPLPPTVDVEPPIAAEDTAARSPRPGKLSLPPSPFLSSFKDYGNMLTPPPPDLDLANGTERNSILKAISGFWQTPTSRSPFEGDDPMNDPEHIFRDSSMVVRTDEPTSIIALALK